MKIVPAKFSAIQDSKNSHNDGEASATKGSQDKSACSNYETCEPLDKKRKRDQAMDLNFDPKLDAVAHRYDEGGVVIATPSLPQVLEKSSPVKFFRSVSRQGKEVICSDDGFCYGLLKVNKASKNYICTKRNKKNSGIPACGATLTAKGGSYKMGKKQHNHPAEPGLMNKLMFRENVFKVATNESVKSAGLIVDEELNKSIGAGMDPHFLPKPESLRRAINRRRQGNFPVAPMDLSFDTLDFSATGVPQEFLLADVKIEGEEGEIVARHLIFGTKDQLELLQRAHTLYGDATFKACSEPFQQLFILHAFLVKDNIIKQVPLLFVLMSRRTTTDYEAVLKRVISLCPEELQIDSFVVDFEKALMAAIRLCWPRNQVTITGCWFHYCQAVFKNLRDLGLFTSYTTNGTVTSFCKQIMCLPLLPPRHIIPTFQILRERAEVCHNIIPLLNYIDKQWLKSNVWKPMNLSVYKKVVRTNNHSEGYHNRLNSKTSRNHPRFYELAKILHEEGTFVTAQHRMISANRLSSSRRKKSMDHQEYLSNLWQRFEDVEISSASFLEECAAVNMFLELQ